MKSYIMNFVSKSWALISLPGRSPGRAIVLPPPLALASASALAAAAALALAKC